MAPISRTKCTFMSTEEMYLTSDLTKVNRLANFSWVTQSSNHLHEVWSVDGDNSYALQNSCHNWKIKRQ